MSTAALPSHARSRPHRVVGCALLFALGIVSRLVPALNWTTNFDSEEAIHGLVAQDTLRGHVPTYYYGQQYFGTLDGLLSAPLVAWLGSTAVAIRIVPLIMFGAFIAVHAELVRTLWGKVAALVSVLFLVLPSWYLYQFTFKSQIYTDAALAGTLGLLLYCRAFCAGTSRRPIGWPSFFIGLVIGLGLWLHPQTSIYAAALATVCVLGGAEWSELHGRLTQVWRRFTRMPLSVVALATVVIVAGLTTLTFFSGACQPRSTFEPVARGSIAFLVLLAGATAASLVAVTRDHGRLRSGALGAVFGFAAGNLPEWRAWVFYGVAPSTNINPSCPSGAAARASIIANDLLPIVWGLPLVGEFRQLDTLDRLSWLLATAVALVALALFIWRGRAAMWRLLALSPLKEGDERFVLPVLLLLMPLILGVLGSNTEGIHSVRFLLITWQASSIVLGVLVASLATRVPLLALLVAVFWTWRVEVTHFGEMAKRFTVGPSAGISWWAMPELERFLLARQVRGGYSEYWMAYNFDYFTNRRLVVAPLNGIERYPSFAETALQMPREAFIFWVGFLETPPGAATRDDLMRELAKLGISRPGFWPLYDSVRAQINRQRVVERARVGDWDVWVLENSPP